MSRLTTNHRPYKSPMAACCEHAANLNSKKSGYGLRDILRNKKIQQARENIAETFHARWHRMKGPNRRFTIAKRFKNGWHLTGIGFLEGINFTEAKAKAREMNYTHVRYGGSIIQIAEVKIK